MNDFAALFAVTLFATSVSGMLLLCASFMSLHNRALAIWAIGYLLGSAASALIIARHTIDDFWSIDIAYMLLAAAFGLMWKGARRFANRPTPLPFVFAGAAIWFLTCLIVPIHASHPAQGAFISSIIVGYCLLIGLEFWRASGNQLTPCWSTLIILMAYAGTYLVRVFWPGPLLFTTIEQKSGISLSVAISADVLFHVFCAGVFLAFFAMQCSYHDRSLGSMIDPVTGILNRRGFTEYAARAYKLMFINHQCATLVEFDLNWFKTVDGKYEYSGRDDVLSLFCEVVSAALRPCDLFGRLGDRRFVCLFANVTHPEALIVAEKIKKRFSQIENESRRSPVHMTITAGYAVANARHVDLLTLMLEAEDTLQRSKPHSRQWTAAAKTTSFVERIIGS